MKYVYEIKCFKKDNNCDILEKNLHLEFKDVNGVKDKPHDHEAHIELDNPFDAYILFKKIRRDNTSLIETLDYRTGH